MHSKGQELSGNQLQNQWGEKRGIHPHHKIPYTYVLRSMS